MKNFTILLHFIGISLFMVSNLAYGHPGKTNSKGCHNNRKTGDYHCDHSKNSETKRNEDAFNRRLAKHLGGKAESRNYFHFQANRKSFIRVDVETAQYVIEGGLDNKPDSLDSVQQTLFASTLTGKQPVIVIYDTDGIEGKFEYRIKTVAKNLGIKFYNLNWQEIQNLSDF